LENLKERDCLESKWEDNSEIEIKEVRWEDVDWIVCLFVFFLVGLISTAAMKAYCTLTP
jgi:hypothetical protein